MKVFSYVTKESYVDDDLASWDSGTTEYLDIAARKDIYKELIDDVKFLDLLGDLKGKHVLDIGCGDGGFSRKLRDKGATVVATDGAPRMVERAKADDPAGDYRVVDVMKADLPLEKASFDIITAKMVLMMVASVDTLAKNIRPYLKDGGIFAADIVHPFSPLLRSLDPQATRYAKLDDYFHQTRSHVTFSGKDLAFYYRPVSQYINDVLAAGFTLSRVEEVGIERSFVEKYPHLADRVNQPLTLHLIFKK